MPISKVSSSVVVALPNDDLFDDIRDTFGYRGLVPKRVRLASELLALIAEAEPDVTLIYDDLPDMPGEELARMVREVSDAGIIMLSRQTDVQRRAQALEACVDDYVTIPAHNGELFGRTVSLLRRRSGRAVTAEKVVVGELELDFEAHLASLDGAEVELTHTEWRILQVLALYHGSPVPTPVITARVWGSDFNGDGVRLRVHVSNIRKKLEVNSAHPRYILTVPRRGLQLAIK